MAEKIIGGAPGIYREFPRKGNAALKATHYCPGCGHGVLHKLIGEAISDFDIQDRTIAISPVGCAVFAYYYFDCGNIQAAHGRAPAVATGISRARTNAIVISYQGDGDLASIGLNETLQAANRGEKIAVIFINNTVYGMTSGQMAPTTLIGEKTVTCPEGRDPKTTGYPIHMCELIDTLKAPIFIERVALSDIQNVKKARRAIRKAIQIQKENKGYAFVEVLSTCPVNLKQDAQEGIDFINNQMQKEFPLGNLRDNSEQAMPVETQQSDFSKTALDELFKLQGTPSIDFVDRPEFGQLQVKMAGFGGQGILSMGVILASAGCVGKYYSSWYPYYGPEQRGGTANCSVVISGMPIGSPAVPNPDILVAMNKPSLDKFADEIKSNGVILCDQGTSDNQPEKNIIAVPAIEIAKNCGAAKAANTAMLGVIMQLGKIDLTEKMFNTAIAGVFETKPKLIAINQKILHCAANWAKENISPKQYSSII